MDGNDLWRDPSHTFILAPYVGSSANSDLAPKTENEEPATNGTGTSRKLMAPFEPVRQAPAGPLLQAHAPLTLPRELCVDLAQYLVVLKALRNVRDLPALQFILTRAKFRAYLQQIQPRSIYDLYEQIQKADVQLGAVLRNFANVRADIEVELEFWQRPPGQQPITAVTKQPEDPIAEQHKNLIAEQLKNLQPKNLITEQFENPIAEQPKNPITEQPKNPIAEQRKNPTAEQFKKLIAKQRKNVIAEQSKQVIAKEPNVIAEESKNVQPGDALVEEPKTLSLQEPEEQVVKSLKDLAQKQIEQPLAENVQHLLNKQPKAPSVAPLKRQMPGLESSKWANPKTPPQPVSKEHRRSTSQPSMAISIRDPGNMPSNQPRGLGLRMSGGLGLQKSEGDGLEKPHGLGFEMPQRLDLSKSQGLGLAEPRGDESEKSQGNGLATTQGLPSQKSLATSYQTPSRPVLVPLRPSTAAREGLRPLPEVSDAFCQRLIDLGIFAFPARNDVGACKVFLEDHDDFRRWYQRKSSERRNVLLSTILCEDFHHLASLQRAGDVDWTAVRNDMMYGFLVYLQRRYEKYRQSGGTLPSYARLLAYGASS